jgi:STE24 endopeptidase
MSVQTIFILIISIFIAETLLTKILGYLNTLRWSDTIPAELKDIYDADKYASSQKYERAKYTFAWYSSIPSFLVMLLILAFGGFGWLDDFFRQFTENEILLALYFFGTVSLISTIVSIPFSYYSTFVIEEKFGFNKMTKNLFFADALK